MIKYTSCELLKQTKLNLASSGSVQEYQMRWMACSLLKYAL